MTTLVVPPTDQKPEELRPMARSCIIQRCPSATAVRSGRPRRYDRNPSSNSTRGLWRRIPSGSWWKSALHRTTIFRDQGRRHRGSGATPFGSSDPDLWLWVHGAFRELRGSDGRACEGAGGQVSARPRADTHGSVTPWPNGKVEYDAVIRDRVRRHRGAGGEKREIYSRRRRGIEGIASVDESVITGRGPPVTSRIRRRPQRGDRRNEECRPTTSRSRSHRIPARPSSTA